MGSRLVCVTAIITVFTIGYDPVSAAKLEAQNVKAKKSPTGGYRTILDAQESVAKEQFTHDQFSPRGRSFVNYGATSSVHASLPDGKTAEDTKAPLSLQIQDHSPWRPIASESTASHRIHKTTFSKGFKFHSFADQKHVSGEPLPAGRGSIGNADSYAGTASVAPEQVSHFLVPSSYHQQRQRTPRYERVQDEPHEINRRPQEEYQRNLNSPEKPDHLQHVAYQSTHQSSHQQSPQSAEQDVFKNAEKATVNAHSIKQYQTRQHNLPLMDSGAPQHQQTQYYQARQQYHHQQQPIGHEQVQYVYADEQQGARNTKGAASTEQAGSGRHTPFPTHLGQQHPQQHGYTYGETAHYTSQNAQQHSTGKEEEEEPSDDVLLAHIPLPKSKIAVEMDDTDDGRLQRQSDGPNTIPDEKSQHSTQNAGPIYRVINPADNREISVGTDAQSLEYDFKQHFRQSHAKRHDGRSSVEASAYRGATLPRSQNLRKERHFTVRASAVTPREDHTLYSKTQAYIIPQQHALHQTDLQTPAGFQASFRKATLQQSTDSSKSFPYIPVMIAYDGRPHNHMSEATALIAQDTIDKQLQHRLSNMPSIVSHHMEYLNGFPLTDQAVTRIPSLTRDIQTYIKKKSA
ncbi:uncharacterized protein LOC111251587 isoform X1 [Varroa destructor]|uniref:Uncharacterized protein n=1 Tax=Varroa destructor TaxID=109461 RepID=A0A7M7MBF8_VARDE|nr:uncharacterized protein LOC111251587 isoform X1 [Varroa destructor]XP_022664008.1 uncharacterized protein LOC111251587 isoform X1 [Varroa destructor]